jgi:ubiquinone/menaquinone biosynthesis C-methylase UbiE
VHTDWLTETRTAYDTVASSFAEQLRDLLSTTPYERAAFGLFADQVRACGGGPVADVGCGAGRITSHLHGLGLEAFGIDLSPQMIAQARSDHPGLRFEVGSMTGLDLADASLGGLVAWYSLIHVPDANIAGVLAGFRRVLRPSCPLLVAFHAGVGSTVLASGYGHSIQLQVHRREPGQVIEWLAAAGFTVEAQMRLASGESRDGAILFAR